MCLNICNVHAHSGMQFSEVCLQLVSQLCRHGTEGKRGKVMRQQYIQMHIRKAEGSPLLIVRNHTGPEAGLKAGLNPGRL